MVVQEPPSVREGMFALPVTDATDPRHRLLNRRHQPGHLDREKDRLETLSLHRPHLLTTPLNHHLPHRLQTSLHPAPESDR